MIKNLKRVLAIVLSFTTLFFKGPVCFSMNCQGEFELEKIVVDQGNDQKPREDDDSPAHDEPQSEELKIKLVQRKSEVGKPATPQDEISYTARKIKDSDLGRCIEYSDHSCVRVPPFDFFLYPPKSVKELFQIKDKASAFNYSDATRETSVSDKASDGCAGCCRLHASIIKDCFIAGISLLLAIGSLSNLYLSLGNCKVSIREGTVDSCDIDNAENLNWMDWYMIGMCIICVSIFAVSAYKLYKSCSKSCCDCYVCKPSDYGCSCGYGCCNDGNKCVCCVDVLDCEDNCFAKCCPCDNGVAIDFCGSYGTGRLGKKAYEDILDKENCITSVEDFQKFIEEVSILPKSIPDENKWKFIKNILIGYTIEITKKRGKAIFSISDNCNNSDMYLVPLAVRNIFGNGYPSQGEGVSNCNYDSESFRGFMNAGRYWQDELGETFEFFSSKNGEGKFGLPDKNSEIFVDRFIRSLLWECKNSLDGKMLNRFETVALLNFINFIKALSLEGRLNIDMSKVPRLPRPPRPRPKTTTN